MLMQVSRLMHRDGVGISLGFYHWFILLDYGSIVIVL